MEEKCQRPAAGSCPTFLTPALQNPTQIFPGSDTVLALGSLLHAERNKRRITPTVLKWERMNFKVWWRRLLNFREREKKCIYLWKSLENMFYITVVWQWTFYSWFWDRCGTNLILRFTPVRQWLVYCETFHNKRTVLNLNMKQQIKTHFQQLQT